MLWAAITKMDAKTKEEVGTTASYQAQIDRDRRAVARCRAQIELAKRENVGLQHALNSVLELKLAQGVGKFSVGGS